MKSRMIVAVVAVGLKLVECCRPVIDNEAVPASEIVV